MRACDMIEALFSFLVILSLVTVVGHGVWLLVARGLRSLLGVEAETKGTPVPDPQEDLRAFERVLSFLQWQEKLTADERSRLRDLAASGLSGQTPPANRMKLSASAESDLVRVIEAEATVTDTPPRCCLIAKGADCRWCPAGSGVGRNRLRVECRIKGKVMSGIRWIQIHPNRLVAASGVHGGSAFQASGQGEMLQKFSGIQQYPLG
ncbi:MAG: hypothetical protein R3C05_14170 [Pirellulaceae bacterium]